MLKAKSFPELIRWIADTYHDGVVDAIASRAKISGALVDKWVKGKVRAPRPDTLMKLCRAYHLPFAEVLRLAYSDLGKIGAMIALVALLSAWGVRADAHTNLVSPACRPAPYRKLSRLLWGLFVIRAQVRPVRVSPLVGAKIIGATA